jgi:hypothetical protein
MICEQDIYRALAEGVIPSPTTWQGSTYVCIRATGVGVAYRASPGGLELGTDAQALRGYPASMGTPAERYDYVKVIC